jgi:hypothetical protein
MRPRKTPPLDISGLLLRNRLHPHLNMAVLSIQAQPRSPLGPVSVGWLPFNGRNRQDGCMKTPREELRH